MPVNAPRKNPARKPRKDRLERQVFESERQSKWGYDTDKRYGVDPAKGEFNKHQEIAIQARAELEALDRQREERRKQRSR